MNGPYDTGRFADVGSVNQVNSHADLAQVVRLMQRDLDAHPDEWENHTLDRFLDALARSVKGLPGLYANRGEQFPDNASWKVLAEALVMASGYE